MAFGKTFIERLAENAKTIGKFKQLREEHPDVPVEDVVDEVKRQVRQERLVALEKLRLNNNN
jgi:hypothetical protein